MHPGAILFLLFVSTPRSLALRLPALQLSRRAAPLIMHKRSASSALSADAADTSPHFSSPAKKGGAKKDGAKKGGASTAPSTPTKKGGASAASSAPAPSTPKTPAANYSDSPPTPSPRSSHKSPQKPSRLPGMPSDFHSLHSLVSELRADRTAPVDSNGAEELCIEDPDDPVTYRYHALIALMLSSQTKDAQVGAAMRRLQAHPGGLTVAGVHKMDEATLKQLIFGVGFHNNKTVYIKKSTAILVEKFGGDVPPTAAEMIKELPGVGPKMAFLVDQIAWRRAPAGIGVDTHMHVRTLPRSAREISSSDPAPPFFQCSRPPVLPSSQRMFNVLKWVESKNPEDTRLQLEHWLPQSYWEDVNLLWVGFGQQTQQVRTAASKMHHPWPSRPISLLLSPTELTRISPRRRRRRAFGRRWTAAGRPRRWRS